MATTYNTAFGSLPGYNELLGTTNTTGGGQQQTYGAQPKQTPSQLQQPAQTFAQMQKQGVARPAPPVPQDFSRYAGSQQAQQMRQRLQEQLQQFGQAPSRFDTQAFQQIRGAQQANLRSEFEEQQRKLNEDLARRGLSASTIGAAGTSKLAGAQSRALADIDTQLLQRAAETQAQDRAQLLSEGRGLAELASAQDLQQFEANRVAQAAEFENQLRAAQFGQQQYESEQGFGFRFGELTGELGGTQTLSARQQQEQRRQFDMEQALRQVLGLGGLGVQQEQLGLERERMTQQQADAAAERTLRETMQTRELSAQEKQQLADITSRKELQTQQLAQQREQFTAQLTQQRDDAVAERALREKLQTAELTAQEKQQLADIDARKALQTQQITEQARQFGLDLKEREAARLQQGGFTTEELAIRREQVDNELAIQNRRLTEEERNNLAINGLERDRFEADKDFRANQLKLNRDELEQRADQIKEDQRLRGVEIDDQRAYRDAEIDLRTTQISNEYTRAGQQIDVDKARIQAQKDISSADNAAQLARLEKQTASQERIATADRAVQQTQLNFQNAARLSEQSGFQYTVTKDGVVEPLKDPKTGEFVPTSTVSQAALNRQQQKSLTELETNLRRELGLTEATGKLVTIDPVTKQLVVSTDTIAGRRAAAEEQQTLIQRAMQFSEQSGIQYQVNADKTITPVRDANNNVVPTSAAYQARLERSLREQIAMTEATGQVYTRDATTGAVALGTGANAARTIQAQTLAFQRAAQLSEQSGIQHEVKADGTVSPIMVNGQPVRTSAESRFNLDLQFRRQMQLMEQTGDLYNIDPTTGRATLATGAEAASTLGRLQQNLQAAQMLSQITGNQYTVDSNGRLVMAPAQGAKVTESRRQFDLEQNLRRALGLAETTGYAYNPDTGQLELVGGAAQRTIQGQLAQNQMFLQLAGVLSGLTGDQLEKLKRGEYAAPGKPEIGTVSPDGAWRWNGTAWVPNTTSSDDTTDDNTRD